MSIYSTKRIKLAVELARLALCPTRGAKYPPLYPQSFALMIPQFTESLRPKTASYGGSYVAETINRIGPYILLGDRSKHHVKST